MDFGSARGLDYTFFQQQFSNLASLEDMTGILRNELPGDTSLVDYLARVNPERYDQRVAALLSVASTWAYADADSMARNIRTAGIPNNQCVSLHEKNNALFLDTTAHLTQSECGKVLILGFGGTDPTNVIHLLSDTSAKKEPFFSMGAVHGGIFHSFLPLWRLLRIMLKGAQAKYPICDMNEADHLFHRCHTQLDSTPDRSAPMPVISRLGANPEDPHCNSPTTSRVSSRTEGREELEALYITGHSLGGALGVLAAAAIHADPLLEPLREKLRGVYTFGQVMVGDPVFCETFGAAFGDLYFRHVYRKDLVPHLPPITMGCFEHFGHELTEQDGTWVLRGTPVNRLFTGGAQAWAGVMGLGFGAVAWVRDQFPFLSWLPLPYSLGDHSPLNYLRTSRASVPGSELL